MKKIIEKVCAESSLAAIYTNQNDSTKFAVAKIVHYDDEFVFFKSFDEQGCFDGFEIKRIEDIFLIEVAGKYLEELAVEDGMLEFKIEKQQTCMENLYSIVKDNNFCISAELANSGNFDVRGTVISIKNDCISCQTYCDDGGKDAIAFFMICDISCLTIHSQEDVEMEMKILEYLDRNL